MGLFITLEGIEGSGKTTQNRRLAEFLSQNGHSVVQTREPGGTVIGQALRALILEPQTVFEHPLSEVLLFYADRLEHISSVIIPALDAGKIVLCDRFIDSTIAYQIGGRGMLLARIEALNDFVDVMPDLTLLLDISPEEGLKRATKRANLDRFEQEDLSFHHRVRDKYLEQAKKYPQRIRRILVQGLNPDHVFERVKDEVLQFIERKKND